MTESQPAVAFKGALDALRVAVHEQFPDSARRQQFDSHLDTVAMTIDHLQAETPRDGAASTKEE